MVKLIIAWHEQEPFLKIKKLGENTIECGIDNLLRGLDYYDTGKEIEVILVINIKSSININEYYFYASCKHLKKILYHDNTGLDFGAYNKGYYYLLENNYKGDLVFLNTSCRAPDRDNWLKEYCDLFNKHENIGLCGISMNSHDTSLGMNANSIFNPHIQSFFIYSNMKIIKSVFGDNISGHDTNDRVNSIVNGEIEISRKILDAGFGLICRAFPNFVYFNGDKWNILFGDLRYKKDFLNYANQI